MSHCSNHPLETSLAYFGPCEVQNLTFSTIFIDDGSSKLPKREEIVNPPLLPLDPYHRKITLKLVDKLTFAAPQSPLW